MKSASTALINLLLTGQFVQADLYSIALTGSGDVIRLTTCDADVIVGSHTWSSKGPYIDSDQIQRATAHWKVGLDVDTWQVAITPRTIDPLTGFVFPDTIGGQPWLAACLAGALDGADVQIDRAYWPNWSVSSVPLVPVDVLTAVFAGRVADVDVTRSSSIITINSHIELLTRTMMPRNLHQTSCIHNLFDPGCALLASSFAQAGFVSGITTQSQFAITAPAATGSGTYTLGRIVFTSGGNVGFSRMVKSYDPVANVLKTTSPLPFALQLGDTFTIYPGCDKSQSTCTKFGNLANYGGEPFIPYPESSI